jgi:hypothetical protein
MIAKLFPHTISVLVCSTLLSGVLVNRLFGAESFLDTECLHKAPAGIALTTHVAKAKSGNVQSMFCAGAIKLYVSREYKEAMPWLEKAANAGHMRAPLVLGILYEQGSGVKQDAATAAKWYQKGMENGNAAAVRRLANLHHLGTGVPHDEEKSRELLKRAAEMGDKAAPKFIEKRERDLKDRRPGMTIKAEAYRLYKQKKFKEAATLYRQCAEMGNDDCQLAMGQLYEFGDGVLKDERQAAPGIANPPTRAILSARRRSVCSTNLEKAFPKIGPRHFACTQKAQTNFRIRPSRLAACMNSA